MKINILIIICFFIAIITNAQGPLVLQLLDYTENPVDIQNPDRGFVKSNDDHTADGPLVLPISGKVAISEWTGKPWNMQYGPLTLGGVNPGRSIVTSNIWCKPGVIQFYIDLRHFSSRSRLNNTDPIKHGKTQALTEDALIVLRDALLFVREKTNCTVHLRPTYDGMGWSYNGRYDTEPEGMCTVEGFEHLNWVQYHLLQLKPIFHEFEDIIMAIDSGTFGPWGEIHTSTMSRDPEANAMLLNALLDAVPPSRSIIAKAGPFVAWYNAMYGTNIGYAIHGHLAINQNSIVPPPSPGSTEARFGFFDDSYMRGNFDHDNFWNLARGQNNFFGGELGGGTYDTTFFYTTPPVLIHISALCQTTYLCAEWSGGRLKVLEAFPYTKDKIDVDITFPHNNKTVKVIYDPVYEGKNVLEYFRDRLGYRLVLREAKTSEWVNQNGILQFEGKIQNVGFGVIVNKKRVSVILKSKTDDQYYTALTNIDARDWLPDLNNKADNTSAWRNLNFSVNLSAFGNIPTGEYEIYLKINDPKEQSTNRRCIQFANHNIWNPALGANLIGTTTIK